MESGLGGKMAIWEFAGYSTKELKKAQELIDELYELELGYIINEDAEDELHYELGRRKKCQSTSKQK